MGRLGGPQRRATFCISRHELKCARQLRRKETPAGGKLRGVAVRDHVEYPEYRENARAWACGLRRGRLGPGY